MVEFTLLAKSDFKTGGRLKRGGDPDQAPVVEQTLDIDLPSVDVDVSDGAQKASLKAMVMGAIKKSVEVMHTALSSEAVKNVAILGLTVAASVAAINRADEFYGKDVCSPMMTQLASAMANVGLTGSRDKCDIAMKAYNDTFALLRPMVASALGAATGRLLGIKINIGEGFITNAMNKVVSNLEAPPPAPPAPAPALVAESAPALEPALEPAPESAADSAPAKKKKRTGGRRTRRRGSKKNRKSRKSRR